MQVRDFLRPVMVLHNRHTLAEALKSIDERIPVFVRCDEGWRYMAPADVVGFPSSRRMIDLPLRPIAPIAADTELRVAILQGVNGPIAVEDFGEIIGHVDPSQFTRGSGASTASLGGDPLLLRVLEPLAHDLGNAMFALVASMEGLDESEANRDALACRSAVKHATSMLQRLREICSGAAETAPLHLDVASAITGMLDLLRLVCGAGVEISLNLEHPLPAVRWHQRSLERCLLNLVLNASQAMRHKGRIAISAATDHRDERAWLVIRVEDNGPGMPAASDAELQQWAVRSKEGSARGLGLVSILQTMNRMGGSVASRTLESGGTAFELRLPTVAG